MSQCYIVGTGPSILNLTKDDFGDGPVITLNEAILVIRKLGLPNTIYTMQKDGCKQGNDPLKNCGGRCPNGSVMIEPIPPEFPIFTTTESNNCFPEYPIISLIDVDKELGLPWYTPSLPVAVAIIAQDLLYFECNNIIIYGCDAWVTDDHRKVTKKGVAYDEPSSRHYRAYAQQAQELADAARIRLVWK